MKILIKNHLKNKNDYTYTHSIPWGLRSEVFSLVALNKCESLIVNQNSTEYLTYYFIRKEYFKTQCVKIKKYIDNEQNFNISIDCLKDLNILKALMEKFNYNINIRRKQISTFLNLNTKPIAVKDKILLKTK